MIAALFVQRDGVYYGLPGVDPWDKRRDARNYEGPHSVVAHPPCNLWCSMARLNEKRYGHAVGDDGGCFAHALHCVRTFGGVLEHPAKSLAWPHFSLPRPAGMGWQRSLFSELWTCEVAQSAYGHKAQKRTWLLYVGEQPPFAMRWGRPAGTHQVGWFDRIKPTLSKAAVSRTPLAFPNALIAIAESVRGEVAA
jgi:hypothetical protein